MLDTSTITRIDTWAAWRGVSRSRAIRAVLGEHLDAYDAERGACLKSPAGAACAAPTDVGGVRSASSDTAVPAPAGRPSARAGRWSGRFAVPRSEYRGAKTEAT